MQKSIICAQQRRWTSEHPEMLLVSLRGSIGKAGIGSWCPWMGREGLLCSPSWKQLKFSSLKREIVNTTTPSPFLPADSCDAEVKPILPARPILWLPGWFCSTGKTGSPAYLSTPKKSRSSSVPLFRWFHTLILLGTRFSFAQNNNNKKHSAHLRNTEELKAVDWELGRKTAV